MRRRDRKSGRTRRQFRPRLWQDIRPAHAACRDDFFILTSATESVSCGQSTPAVPLTPAPPYGDLSRYIANHSSNTRTQRAQCLPHTLVRLRASVTANLQSRPNAWQLWSRRSFRLFASHSHHPMFATWFEQSRIDCAGIRLRRDRRVYNHALHAQGVDHAGALGRVACLGRNSPKAASPSRCATALGSTD